VARVTAARDTTAARDMTAARAVTSKRGMPARAREIAAFAAFPSIRETAAFAPIREIAARGERPASRDRPASHEITAGCGDTPVAETCGGL